MIWPALYSFLVLGTEFRALDTLGSSLGYSPAFSNVLRRTHLADVKEASKIVASESNRLRVSSLPNCTAMWPLTNHSFAEP